MVQAVDPEVENAAQLLAQRGWRLEGPAGVAWEPAFTPQFYAAGGDAEGEVYCRIDLPEDLYYAFQEAARGGAAGALKRLEHFRSLERAVSEQERSEATPVVGLLDGMALSSRELRSLITDLAETVRRFERALDRADTRRHKA